MRPRQHAKSIIGLVTWFTFVSILASIALLEPPFWMLITANAFSGSLLALTFFHCLPQDLETYVARGFDSNEQTVNIPKGHYFITRTLEDEARYFLVTLQFVSMVGSKAGQAVGWAVRKQLNMWPMLFWVGLAVISIVVPYAVVIFADFWSIGICTTITELLHGRAPVAAVGLFLPVALIAIVFYLSAFLLVIGLLAQAATIAFFGWTNVIDGFLVEFAAEPTPVGIYEFANISWVQGENYELAHSSTYLDPIALGYLKRWVMSLLQSSHKPQQKQLQGFGLLGATGDQQLEVVLEDAK
jgi:hypothetical protein